MHEGRAAFSVGPDGDDADLGPLPTRAQLVDGQCTFQGLVVDTVEYGRMPLFDPAIFWLSEKADRLACYAAKRAAGDTIVVVCISGQYHENDASNFLERIPGRDFTSDDGLRAFEALAVEALTDGKMTGLWVWLAGDGPGAGPGYNDPGGMTYGHDWLMATFARIRAGLPKIRGRVVWFPGADGVVPGWAGDENRWQRVNDWLLYARSVVTDDECLGLHFSAGYGSWSGEQDDFATLAGQCIDLSTYECPYPMGPPAPPPANFCALSDEDRRPFDQIYQISKRWLGRLYRRPSDQPACDDAGETDGYTAQTPRGPRGRCALEFDTYGAVRGLSPDVTAARRAFLRAIGWPNVG